MKYYFLILITILTAIHDATANDENLCKYGNKLIQTLKMCKDKKSCLQSCQIISSNSEISDLANTYAYVMTGVPMFMMSCNSMLHDAPIYKMVISDLSKDFSEQCH
ncbi:MAG: hypothetical protein CMF41_01980 [Legionellales bacterium]|nr:hypothetical protein [Legionellales bacterium]OUX65840.1 MAG: hypothetical protein CBE41_01175 [Gammaproteobacteria bacterium TMED281]|tara:strand:- start:522 stop:839 length:318 start_codon:yes stop_codon:yes gene_type:complete